MRQVQFFQEDNFEPMFVALNIGYDHKRNCKRSFNWQLVDSTLWHGATRRYAGAFASLVPFDARHDDGTNNMRAE